MDLFRFKKINKNGCSAVETSWVSPEPESNPIYQGEYYHLDPGGFGSWVEEDFQTGSFTDEVETPLTLHRQRPRRRW
jgi:hypothetical protein